MNIHQSYASLVIFIYNQKTLTNSASFCFMKRKGSIAMTITQDISGWYQILKCHLNFAV